MAYDYENTLAVYHTYRLYPLAALQIGDIQSYLSELFLHTVRGEKKLVLFVDHSPWTAENERSKPVEFWQLMVTQSRTSPFTNQSLKPAVGRMHSENIKDPDENATEDSGFRENTSRRKLFQKDHGFLVKLFRDLFRRHLKSVVSVQELSYQLHGCIAFELEWANVRGINYVNELQTDTCVAFETKLMVKRDFRNFRQALAFYSVKPEHSWKGWSRSAEAKESTLLHNVQLESNEAQGCTDISSQRLGEFVTGLGSTCPPTEERYQSLYLDEVSSGRTLCAGSPDLSVLKQKQLCGDESSGALIVSDSLKKRNNIDRPALSTSFDKMALDDVDGEFFDAFPCIRHSDRASSSETGSCCPVTIGRDSLNEGSFASKSIKLASQSPGDTGPSGSFPEVGEDAMTADCCSSADLFPHLYRDTLILFRFCDPILPLELKNIITADQRLLKMLESGLPSWVIFLQSYPLVCKVYRPWMCPLARSTYVLVSIVTVIIGFYDLYKNVPVLKATASRICGPLFEWIEAWEMVSRIKYLGTMLFLQNCEKTFRWLIIIFRTFKQLSIMLVKPMIEPLEELSEILFPIWNICSDGILAFTSLLWMVVSSLGEYMNSLVQLIIWPFIVLVTIVWKLATWLLYPVISAVWGLIVLPIQFIIHIVNLLVALVGSIFTAARDLWGFVNSSAQLLSVAGPPGISLRDANSSAYSWQILWNDIFSQVFRAVRSIVNGLVAFLAALNRHRLSIYNHTSAVVLRAAHLLKLALSRISNAYHRVLDTSLRNEGGFEDEDGCSCCEERRSKSSAVRLLLRQTRRKETLPGASLNCANIALKEAKLE